MVASHNQQIEQHAGQHSNRQKPNVAGPFAACFAGQHAVRFAGRVKPPLVCG